jgi:hypothetical protein
MGWERGYYYRVRKVNGRVVLDTWQALPDAMRRALLAWSDLAEPIRRAVLALVDMAAPAPR